MLRQRIFSQGILIILLISLICIHFSECFTIGRVSRTSTTTKSSLGYNKEHQEESSKIFVSPEIYNSSSWVVDIDYTSVNNIQHRGEKHDIFKARSLLVGASALYGTNFALVKLLGDSIPVGINTALRFGLAALFTLPWLLFDENSNDNAEEAWMAAWLGFEVGLWNSIGYVAQALGLETTPASESAFLCSLAVVVVPMLDFASGKRLLHRQWVGAILAVLGVACLEIGSLQIGEQLPTMGDILSMIQPFAFGIGFWRMEKAMQSYPNQACRTTAAQLSAVFLVTLLYGLFSIDSLESIQSFPWEEWITSPSVVFGLMWTGIVTTALSVYMENLALETLSATETTLIFSTEPIFGSAFAAVILGERFGVSAWIGATFILTACVYSNFGLDGLSSILQGSSEQEEENDKKLWFASSTTFLD